MRLKNLSIGYELPKGLVSKAGIQQLRIYIAGTNLFTLSSLHKYGVDPEVPEGSPAYYYPQQRTLSVGLNLSFNHKKTIDNEENNIFNRIRSIDSY